jgi:hypothetical protein
MEGSNILHSLSDLLTGTPLENHGINCYIVP